VEDVHAAKQMQTRCQLPRRPGHAILTGHTIRSKIYNFKRGLEWVLSNSLLGMQDAKYLKMPATVNHAGGPGRK